MLANYNLTPTIPAADLGRARRFYERVLGLTPVQESADGIIYRCGQTELLLYPTTNAGTAQHTLMAWMVDDIEAVVAHLRAQGVVFEEYDFPNLKTVNGIAELASERSAWFKDSEGNILAVGQPK
ncbi:MAG: VOC family protein [Chloroflexi bacterium CFX4]|nr:VOC family protein [Chloroflexi bacterium CFX4]MDL1921090.1 VOC family protein [Chloroflexi bacterium CFX3]